MTKTKKITKRDDCEGDLPSVDSANKPTPNELLPYEHRLTKLFRTDRINSLKFAYQVGEVLVEVKAEVDKLAKTKGSLRDADDRLIVDFADSQKIHCRTLYNYRRFALEYSKEELASFYQKKGLTLSHLIELFTIPCKKRRAKLITMICEGRLTVSDLKLEIRRQPAGHKPRGSGRPVKPPLSLGHALTKTSQYTAVCVRKLNSVFEEEQFGLTQELENCDATDYMLLHRSETNETIDGLTELIKLATNWQQQLINSRNEHDNSDEYLTELMLAYQVLGKRKPLYTRDTVSFLVLRNYLRRAPKWLERVQRVVARGETDASPNDN
jgi:hypothetical protein